MSNEPHFYDEDFFIVRENDDWQETWGQRLLLNPEQLNTVCQSERLIHSLPIKLVVAELWLDCDKKYDLDIAQKQAIVQYLNSLKGNNPLPDDKLATTIEYIDNFMIGLNEYDPKEIATADLKNGALFMDSVL